MKQLIRIIFVFTILLLLNCSKDNNTTEEETLDFGQLNLDFEIRDSDNTASPKTWNLNGPGYNIYLDDQEKHKGKLSLKMEMPGNRNGNYGVCSMRLPADSLIGNIVELKGWIKTREVKNGYAGLWFRVDGEKEVRKSI